MNPIEDRLTQPDGLVEQLLALRDRADLSSKDLAERANWHPSKVSKIGNGRQVPTPADITTWVLACGADEKTVQELLSLLEDVHATHREWRRRMRRGQVAVQASYNDLIAGCRVVRYFETVFIPGILQTPDYARRILAEMATLHEQDPGDVDAAVVMRMQRQQSLYDTTKQFEFLLTEPALRWLLCPPAAMRGQLDRLQTIIGMPNIRFGVIPLNSPLAITPQNSFQLYDDMAITETFIGESVYQDNDAANYARILDLLWEEARIGEEARPLITAAAQALPT